MRMYPDNCESESHHQLGRLLNLAAGYVTRTITGYPSNMESGV